MDKLILFTKSRCKGCTQARQLLRKLDVSYEEFSQTHPNEFFPPASTYEISVFPTLVLVPGDDRVTCKCEKIEGFAAKTIRQKISEWKKAWMKYPER
jgi:glutaredoxin